jgi:hypothetical protein
MTEGQFAEFFLRQGQKVIETKTCFWYSHRPFLYMSLPYYRAFSPSQGELARVLLGGPAAALRFPTEMGKSRRQVGILVCSDKGYDLSSLHPKSRSATRQGLQNCRVEQFDFAYLARHGHQLNVETFRRQGRDVSSMTEVQWQRLCQVASDMPDFEVWGAFVDGNLAAFSVLALVGDWVLFQHGSSATVYLKYNPNNALTFEVTKRKLADPRVSSLCYGAESPVTPQLDAYKLRMGYRRHPFAERIVYNPLLRGGLALGGRRIIQRIARKYPQNVMLQRAALLLERDGTPGGDGPPGDSAQAGVRGII